MRRSVITAILILLLAPVLPAASQQRVTAAELDRILADSQNKPDADLAAQLSDLRLTERFSGARLTHWRSALSGPRSQRALLAIADRSAFLAPAAADVPPQPAPDVTGQRQIMGLTATYVTQAIAQLPRFVAARTITHFESAAAASGSVPDDFGALQAVRLSRASVQYRDGEEIVDSGMVKVSKKTADQGLRTWGVFGPILSLVLLDAAQNQLAWSHWEQGASGPLAVFRYAVSREKSHYQIRYCCVLSSYGMESNIFEEMSGYHGEIAVNPDTGTILRLKLEADLQPSDPISRANLLVEYAPVDLGGQTFILPARSISISVARTIRAVQDPGGHAYNTMGPTQMLLNNADFEQYHLFRGDSRVLSGNEERTAGLAPDATLPATQPEDAQPSEEILAQSPAAAMTAASGSEAPEISAATATSLPEAAAHPIEPPLGSQPSGFTLHINARLVDVNVVALDKKGHPITGLKQEDFEVYDNGVKQDVRSFGQADTPAAPQSPAPATTAATPGQSFTNRPGPDAASAAQAGSAAGGNLFVLVIDPANLIYTDMVNARQQALEFLRQIPANERVALYLMRYRTFQILQEATT